MGVAGSGKTLIGTMLAHDLGWPFLDADAFHSAEAIAKMASGIPLDERDRTPWLERIRAKLATVDNAVLACSALTESFRRRLREGFDMRFIHLRGDYALIDDRLHHREAHFFAPELLRSQFETLEEPEDAITIDAALPPQTIVSEIKRAMH